MYQDLLDKKAKLAVIGLGYVGLPIALEFAKIMCPLACRMITGCLGETLSNAVVTG